MHLCLCSSIWISFFQVISFAIVTSRLNNDLTLARPECILFLQKTLPIPELCRVYTSMVISRISAHGWCEMLWMGGMLPAFVSRLLLTPTTSCDLAFLVLALSPYSASHQILHMQKKTMASYFLTLFQWLHHHASHKSGISKVFITNR